MNEDKIYRTSRRRIAGMHRRNWITYLCFTIFPLVFGILGILNGNKVLVVAFLAIQFLAALPAFLVMRSRISKIDRQTCRLENGFLSVFFDDKPVVKVPVAAIVVPPRDKAGNIVLRKTDFKGPLSSLDWYEDGQELAERILLQQSATP